MRSDRDTSSENYGTASGENNGAPHGENNGEAMSPFTLLLSAFAVLLHKFTGEEDITVGSSSLTSNPLVLRLRISDKMTFEEVVRGVHEVFFDFTFLFGISFWYLIVDMDISTRTCN